MHSVPPGLLYETCSELVTTDEGGVSDARSHYGDDDGVTAELRSTLEATALELDKTKEQLRNKLRIEELEDEAARLIKEMDVDKQLLTDRRDELQWDYCKAQFRIRQARMSQRNSEYVIQLCLDRLVDLLSDGAEIGRAGVQKLFDDHHVKHSKTPSIAEEQLKAVWREKAGLLIGKKVDDERLHIERRLAERLRKQHQLSLDTVEPTYTLGADMQYEANPSFNPSRFEKKWSAHHATDLSLEGSIAGATLIDTNSSLGMLEADRQSLLRAKIEDIVAENKKLSGLQCVMTSNNDSANINRIIRLLDSDTRNLMESCHKLQYEVLHLEQMYLDAAILVEEGERQVQTLMPRVCNLLANGVRRNKGTIRKMIYDHAKKHSRRLEQVTHRVRAECHELVDLCQKQTELLTEVKLESVRLRADLCDGQNSTKVHQFHKLPPTQNSRKPPKSTNKRGKARRSSKASGKAHNNWKWSTQEWNDGGVRWNNWWSQHDACHTRTAHGGSTNSWWGGQWRDGQW
eukprot:GEMP01050670.1.p1 GENE.GEMP01050670.1~~GEMP01050670.1.p1  ORF type:complete len:516 (+),score=105.24 GEMP01050670.1:58-1605(+)